MSSHLHFLIPFATPIPRLNLLIPLLLLFSSLATASSSLSTIAVTELGNQTLVCALFPSVDNCPYALKCTAFPSGKSHTYDPLGGVLYSAVAAGNGFLCALGSSPTNFSVSSMRWWDIAHGPNHSKRVYEGPTLSALVAGDSHVCGLVGNSGEPYCWRWPEISIPSGLRLSAISVGKDFVCGLSDNSGEVLCFGGNASGVIGNEPKGEFSVIAAGTRHACVVGTNGDMVCWGAGSPAVAAREISSLALGMDRTCAIRVNGTVSCFGPNAELPPGYETAQFMSVGGRGTAFCGVLTENYSVICWGIDAFRRNPVIFSQVLPGSCSSISRCSCGVVPGSGNSCGHGGGICQSCPNQTPFWPPPPPPPPTPPPPRPTAASFSPPIPTLQKRRRKLLFIILGALGFAIGCLASASFFIIRAKNRGNRIHDSGRGLPAAANSGEPTIDDRVFSLYSKGPGQTVVEYPIETLLAATDHFSEKHKIGSGGFGSVYRAVLPDGRTVAVKRGKAPPTSATPSNSRNIPRCRKEMESAFLAELALLSRVNHKNLVRLYGFCREGAELILVYEFMTRGTLDDHLRNSGHKESPLRSWAGRIRVALDAARGIEYLHVYAVPTIIHRDIKSSNILLDEEWTAKVSDFGLSLLNPKEGEEEEEVAVTAAGTVGYMDPEYYRLRRLTEKSDVYSFGVMLLEVLTGSRAVERSGESGTPRNLVEYAVPRIEMDEVHCVLDGGLPPPTPCEIEAVAFVGYLAADCVSPAGRDRPTMSEVVAGLERAFFAAGNGGGGAGEDRVHAVA